MAIEIRVPKIANSLKTTARLACGGVLHERSPMRSSRACAQTLLKQPSAALERRSARACAQALLKPYPSEIEKITLKTIIGHF
ncbi:hypothetical protein BpHYR1_028917 [Brachionus plicatilis]|uniref:Uncharacterized protein n=1 Tax=Brachionus plicatilis TaxID=10195 RepID=A0A3M7PTW9_BRAPC|nr:hypothetical protein BpHYR1_028917 [Brachionus plicatilis]